VVSVCCAGAKLNFGLAFQLRAGDSTTQDPKAASLISDVEVKADCERQISMRTTADEWTECVKGGSTFDLSQLCFDGKKTTY